MNWTVTMLTVLGVLLGLQLGAPFMAKKAKVKWAKQTYAVVLLVIAAKLLLEALGVWQPT